jgi:hypothetical protein
MAAIVLPPTLAQRLARLSPQPFTEAFKAPKKSPWENEDRQPTDIPYEESLRR